MIYELQDTAKAEKLFEGWEETLIWSCLQKVMGKVYVTDLENPGSVMAMVGDFAFFAGEPDRELVLWKPKNFLIMTPQNEAWAALIEECFPKAEKVKRYAIRKDTKFDREKLETVVASLPEGYEVRRIDSELYDQCLALTNPDEYLHDLVSTFGSKEEYLELGRGMAVLKDGKVVSGASSYTRYREGIEIEVDTLIAERHKGLAGVACAALILACLDEGLYPSWDAANLTSVHLAEKLGYEFSHEYYVYFVSE